MRRVMIIGGPGSGKSTLAREIGARLALPVYHIDALFWQPGWVEGDRSALTERLRAIHRTREWVIDGNYSGSWEDRLAHADTAILLDRPTGLRAWRVLRRTLRYLGRTRPDLAPGCPEHVDPGFVRFVLGYGGERRRRALALLATAPTHVVVHHIRDHAGVAELSAGIARQRSVASERE
ncbi:MAG: hypothetical protein AAGC57_07235 [Pseudomonadota bacterium]